MNISLSTFADNLRNAMDDTCKTGNLSSLSSIMQLMYDTLDVPYRGRASMDVPGCSLEVSLPEPSCMGSQDADFFSRHLQVVLDLPAGFDVGDSDYLEADAGDDEITLEVVDDPGQGSYAVITLIKHFEFPWDAEDGDCEKEVDT